MAQDLGLRGFESEGSAEVVKKSDEKEIIKGNEIGEIFCHLNSAQDSEETAVGENTKCGSGSESISETCKGEETTVFNNKIEAPCKDTETSNDKIEELLGEDDIADVSLSEKSEENVEEGKTSNPPALVSVAEDVDPTKRDYPREKEHVPQTLLSATASTEGVAVPPVKKRNRKEMRATLQTSLSCPGKKVKHADNVVEVKDVGGEGALCIEELDSQIMSLMAQREGLWSCTLCGKEKREKRCLSRHIEGVHISGFKHPCNLCQRILTSRASLGAHKRKFHRKDIGLEF